MPMSGNFLSRDSMNFEKLNDNPVGGALIPSSFKF